MTSTNKAFAYVFNTPAEDHKVARVLSGHDPEKAVALLSLDTFDAETQAKIRRVASALFGASTGLDGKVYNVNARVVDTLMAYLVAPLSVAEGVKADGLAVQLIEACAIDDGFTVNDLLAWSSHLSCTRSRETNSESITTAAAPTDITEHPMFRHQATLIEQLI
ncbi:hypothetical protein PC129_g9279 [Phytophthora cactorum]|uniref:Uncharacterized protein n=1 Tax=Phytophthora cactorum TaxID=29920 RepID=A0A329SG38_9STRA|nr:hypothetical protein Pcac1_g22044 [Phytophthora cactorum]KAG2798242.1 hypothetical protein PC111_g20934 [Phytophthora cactorum]KAG2806259.1 hypothetical protein PC112_g17918 [Phytophthora cactorum]KAG2829406.1 hypothetical protein PC113_g21287 [Phytophthora cactorum]KAG2877522.1 hypothetical protein PC114_g23584 [Phytophthora cactorum]